MYPPAPPCPTQRRPPPSTFTTSIHVRVGLARTSLHIHLLTTRHCPVSPALSARPALIQPSTLDIHTTLESAHDPHDHLTTPLPLTRRALPIVTACLALPLASSLHHPALPSPPTTCHAPSGSCPISPPHDRPFSPSLRTNNTPSIPLYLALRSSTATRISTHWKLLILSWA